MNPKSVRIGFVPTYRGDGNIPEWCVKMRADAIRELTGIGSFSLLVPTSDPQDPRGLDPQKGHTPDGAIWNMDQAGALAEYYRREKVGGIIIGALNFGDERAAAKVAEILRIPVLLYATREPPVPPGPSLARVSDSYCGTLSIAAGLHRRKIPFQFAGILFAEDSEFHAQVDTFVRAVAVVKALKGARIGQIGVRPATFETVGFDEIAMVEKFGQNLIYRDLSDLVLTAQKYADDDPRLQQIAYATRSGVATLSIADE
ncbi:MAG TPA: hypothetical protein PJ988_01935 [Anaerolinea sp.]|nr:hypothetical protein [Anaerolinea sp.]